MKMLLDIRRNLSSFAFAGGRAGASHRQRKRKRRYRPMVEWLEDRRTPSTLFVDSSHPDCSDSGPGTAGQPFCSIGAAAQIAVAGDTVEVASGTYNEHVDLDSSGTQGAPILFTAAAGATVTITGGTNGFKISNESWITIRGFIITGTSDYGISVSNSDNITLENNEISFAGQPQSGQTARGIYLKATTDSHIVGNITHNNTNSGIYLVSGSNNNEIRGNISYENAREYVRAANGIELYGSSGNVVVGNITYNNEDTGIQLRSFARNNLIVNNLTFDDGDHGIDLNNASANDIIGNTVFGSVTSGINVEGGSTDVNIYNNIVADNGINSPRQPGNIRVDSSSTAGTSMDYNLFWIDPGAGQQVLVEWANAEFSSLSAFQFATGQELNGIEADPLFVNSAAGDFHLQAGSPAIDSADSGATGQQNTDIEGLPRIDDPATTDTGAGPRTYDDRGAFEFQPSGSLSISGRVFEDYDGNGNQNGPDQGLAGRVVYLDDNDNGQRDAGETWTTTDSGGNYSFADLDPGIYRVRNEVPADWLQTTADPDDIDALGGQFTADFGQFQKIDLIGKVFEDFDGNGIQEAGDLALANQMVFVDDNDNGVWDGGELSTTTNANGDYAFTDMGPGVYRLRQQLPPGWTLSTAPPSQQTSSSGVDLLGNNFGNFEYASITGQVFDDANSNGSKDAGEAGLAGWTVFLDENDNGVLDAGETNSTTDSQGDYAFLNLGPGVYRPRQVQQGGWNQTTSNPAPISVTSGLAVADQDFGNEQIPQSVFFVDQSHPNCSDSGPGTPSQPFCTISAAVDAATAGYTIEVASGTYNEQVTISVSGTQSSPIIITAAPGANVTVTGGTNGFKISGQSWITIRDFVITGTGSYGIRVNNSSNITIENNEVSFAGAPVQGQTAKGIYFSGVTNSQIIGNDAHDNSDTGIYLTSNSTGNQVTGNHSHNNARGYTQAGGGIELRNSSNNTVSGNFTYGNEDSGIKIFSGSDGALVVNNVTYNNGDIGIDVKQSTSARIISNTIYGNAVAGVKVTKNAAGALIANNIIADNGHNVSSGKANVWVDGSSIAGTTLDYNLVYLDPASSQQTYYLWGSTSYNSLASFASATGMESGGIQADPLFVDPDNGDFHLQAGSPAIDSADSSVSGQPSTDADGNARIDDPLTPNTGAGPRLFDDRGAFEFQP